MRNNSNSNLDNTHTIVPTGGNPVGENDDIFDTPLSSHPYARLTPSNPNASSSANTRGAATMGGRATTTTNRFHFPFPNNNNNNKSIIQSIVSHSHFHFIISGCYTLACILCFLQGIGTIMKSFWLGCYLIMFSIIPILYDLQAFLYEIEIQSLFPFLGTYLGRGFMLIFYSSITQYAYFSPKWNIWCSWYLFSCGWVYLGLYMIKDMLHAKKDQGQVQKLEKGFYNPPSVQMTMPTGGGEQGVRQEGQQAKEQKQNQMNTDAQAQAQAQERERLLYSEQQHETKEYEEAI